MKEIIKLLDELVEGLFSEYEEESDPKIRILRYEVEDRLIEWDKIAVEEIVRISEEYGYKELTLYFWEEQDPDLYLLILDIYNSKEKRT